MADGHALIEINTIGEGRLKELSYFDFRLEAIDFESSEGTEQLMSQLPGEPKDSLVLVVFSYHCETSRSYEGEYDCEELFNVVSHTIVKTNYKELYRELVSEEIIFGINDIFNLDAADDVIPSEDNHYKQCIAEWEEFYDEDFVPFEPKSKKDRDVDAFAQTIRKSFLESTTTTTKGEL